MKNKVHIESIKIDLFAGYELITIFEDGNYIGGGDDSREEILDAFNAEPFHYATVLEGGHQLHSFNTYNYGAPVIACGVYEENFDFAIVNFHRGGDARGNYSQAYYIDGYDHVTSLISQRTQLVISLNNGDTFIFECDNSEAHFRFNTFDIDDCEIMETTLSDEQLEEMREKSSGIFTT